MTVREPWPDAKVLARLDDGRLAILTLFDAGSCEGGVNSVYVVVRARGCPEIDVLEFSLPELAAYFSRCRIYSRRYRSEAMNAQEVEIFRLQIECLREQVRPRPRDDPPPTHRGRT